MANEKITRICLKAYDHKVLDDTVEQIIKVAEASGCKVKGPIPLPTDKQVVTILRATFKYKDSREQFEIRTHKRLIDIVDAKREFMEQLVKLSIPSGVDIKIKL